MRTPVGVVGACVGKSSAWQGLIRHMSEEAVLYVHSSAMAVKELISHKVAKPQVQPSVVPLASLPPVIH